MDHLVAVRMIADEDQARFRFVGMLLLEIGLHTGPHRLHNQPMMPAVDHSKTFCPQNRLLERHRANRILQLLRVLRLVAMEHEGLPTRIMVVEMLVRMLAVRMRVTRSADRRLRHQGIN